MDECLDNRDMDTYMAEVHACAVEALTRVNEAPVDTD